MTDSTVSTQEHKVEFTGTGGEYFKIWITNILLMIVTLGIYFAWAKVRQRRWFYGHTLVDGQGFSYLATPMQILKGRTVVVIFFVIYSIISKVAPLYTLPILGLFFAVLPWLMVNSLRFQARMTAYKGIRFNFAGTVKQSYINFGLMLLTPFTLGLLLPYAAYKMLYFISDGTVYGTSRARTTLRAKSFYKFYFLSMLIFLIPFGLIMYAVYLAVALHNPALIPAAVLSIYLALPVCYAISTSNTINLHYNHMSFDGIHFKSSQTVGSLISIYFINALLTVLTIGFYFPWAKVKLARYHANTMQVFSTQGLDHVVASEIQSVSALSAEAADYVNIDFAAM